MSLSTLRTKTPTSLAIDAGFTADVIDQLFQEELVERLWTMTSNANAKSTQCTLLQFLKTKLDLTDPRSAVKVLSIFATCPDGQNPWTTTNDFCLTAEFNNAVGLLFDDMAQNLVYTGLFKPFNDESMDQRGGEGWYSLIQGHMTVLHVRLRRCDGYTLRLLPLRHDAVVFVKLLFRFPRRLLPAFERVRDELQVQSNTKFRINRPIPQAPVQERGVQQTPEQNGPGRAATPAAPRKKPNPRRIIEPAAPQPLPSEQTESAASGANEQTASEGGADDDDNGIEPITPVPPPGEEQTAAEGGADNGIEPITPVPPPDEEQMAPEGGADNGIEPITPVPPPDEEQEIMEESPSTSPPPKTPSPTPQSPKVASPAPKTPSLAPETPSPTPQQVTVASPSTSPIKKPEIPSPKKPKDPASRKKPKGDMGERKKQSRSPAKRPRSKEGRGKPRNSHHRSRAREGGARSRSPVHKPIPKPSRTKERPNSPKPRVRYRREVERSTSRRRHTSPNRAEQSRIEPDRKRKMPPTTDIAAKRASLLGEPGGRDRIVFQSSSSAQQRSVARRILESVNNNKRELSPLLSPLEVENRENGNPMLRKNTRPAKMRAPPKATMSLEEELQLTRAVASIRSSTPETEADNRVLQTPDPELNVSGLLHSPEPTITADPTPNSSPIHRPTPEPKPATAGAQVLYKHDEATGCLVRVLVSPSGKITEFPR